MRTFLLLVLSLVFCIDAIMLKYKDLDKRLDKYVLLRQLKVSLAFLKVQKWDIFDKNVHILPLQYELLDSNLLGLLSLFQYQVLHHRTGTLDRALFKNLESYCQISLTREDWLSQIRRLASSKSLQAGVTAVIEEQLSTDQKMLADLFRESSVYTVVGRHIGDITEGSLKIKCSFSHYERPAVSLRMNMTNISALGPRSINYSTHMFWDITNSQTGLSLANYINATNTSTANDTYFHLAPVPNVKDYWTIVQMITVNGVSHNRTFDELVRVLPTDESVVILDPFSDPCNFIGLDETLSTIQHNRYPPDLRDFWKMTPIE